LNCGNQARFAISSLLPTREVVCFYIIATLSAPFVFFLILSFLPTRPITLYSFIFFFVFVSSIHLVPAEVHQFDFLVLIFIWLEQWKCRFNLSRVSDFTFTS